MTAKLLLVVLFLSSAIANAGATKAGDGGHGVVCADLPPQLLDLYEAENVYGMSTFFPQDPPIDAFMTIFNARMRVEAIMGKDHPSLAIFDQAFEFLLTKTLEPGAPVETMDAGLPPIRSTCHLVQIARRETGDLNFMLTVDSDYWQNASEEERAMLMIHEGAHAWFPTAEMTPLMPVSALRQFVGLLHSTLGGEPDSDAQIRKLLITREPVMGFVLRR